MKIISIMITTAILLFTNNAYGQMNTSLYIEEIRYRGEGNIELIFKDNTLEYLVMRWSGKETLAVFNKNGEKVPSVINSIGADWLIFHVAAAEENETYTFELRRVPYGGRNDVFFTGFFIAAPDWKIEYRQPPRFRRRGLRDGAFSASVFIQEIGYKHGGKLTIQFVGAEGKKVNLEWSGKENIVVRDETGTFYIPRVLEYGQDRIDIGVHDIVENMDYCVEISNIIYGTEKLSFKTAFTARGNWKYRPPLPARYR